MKRTPANDRRHRGPFTRARSFWNELLPPNWTRRRVPIIGCVALELKRRSVIFDRKRFGANVSFVILLVPGGWDPLHVSVLQRANTNTKVCPRSSCKPLCSRYPTKERPWQLRRPRPITR